MNYVFNLSNSLIYIKWCVICIKNGVKVIFWCICRYLVKYGKNEKKLCSVESQAAKILWFEGGFLIVWFLTLWYCSMMSKLVYSGRADNYLCLSSLYWSILYCLFYPCLSNIIDILIWFWYYSVSVIVDLDVDFVLSVLVFCVNNCGFRWAGV